jgi:hypothetical protein
MPWRHVREWRYSSTILDLCTRWRWVVSFTLRPLYILGNNLWCPLDRRLCGPQSRSGRCAEENSLAPTWNWTQTLQPVARLYTDWAIPAPIKQISKTIHIYTDIVTSIWIDKSNTSGSLPPQICLISSMEALLVMIFSSEIAAEEKESDCEKWQSSNWQTDLHKWLKLICVNNSLHIALVR